MLTVDSPDGRFRLQYSPSISDSIDGTATDDIGIQPDYYLDMTIPNHRWAEHVAEMLSR